MIPRNDPRSCSIAVEVVDGGTGMRHGVQMRRFVVLLVLSALGATGCAHDGTVVADRAARTTDAARSDSSNSPEGQPSSPVLPTEPGPSALPGTPSTGSAVEPSPVEPSPVEPPAVEPSAVETARFTPVTVFDPASNGIAALTVLVPDGWDASGSVQWLPYWSRLAFLQTRVHDPSTGLTIDWLPIQDFMYFTPPAGFDVPIGGNYQGKAYVPPITDPLQFVRDFWMPDTLSHLQNATVISVEQQPVIAQEFLRAFGGPADAGAWRIRYEYDFQGVTWEQDVSFSLLWSGSDPVSWYVNFASTAGAPKGELDRQQGLVSAVIASRTTTVEWEANHRLVTQLFYQGIQQQMADTVRFGELLAQYRAESQALQQQVFDERMASIDRQNEVFRETLGGVQGYDDPVTGGVVQLPLGWDTYWVNQQGEYIAVSDPNFDPNTMNDGFWTELEPRP
jgi:hypothetical protein